MFVAIKNYDNNYLSPFISTETQDFHFDKHHTGYANTLNELVHGTDLEHRSLEEIILMKNEINIKIYNNAAQVYNHDFYWKSLSPNREKSDEMISLLERSFGSVKTFEDSFVNSAMAVFGSGWTWLALDKTTNQLEIINTKNADNLVGVSNKIPILVVDVWEHAYYIDYRNSRKSYLENVVTNCLDWQFAQSQIS